MIPTHWVSHIRAEDGELLGYLIPEMEDAFTPATVFGFPLDSPGSRDEAERQLDEVGLSYLAERWLLNVADQDESINVQIVEVNPEQVTVKSVDYGYERDYGTLFTLTVPVDGQLRLG